MWAETVSPWIAYPLAAIVALIVSVLLAILFGDSPRTTIEFGVGSTISFLLLLMLVPVIGAARDKVRQRVCMSNLHRIGLASLQYAADYDNQLPVASEWTDQVTPYLPEDREHKNRFGCPAAPKYQYGFAMNGAVSEKQATDLASATPLLYDSITNRRNASDRVPLASLPERGRHRKGNDILYTDGHTQWHASEPGSLRHESVPPSGFADVLPMDRHFQRRTCAGHRRSAPL